MPTRCTDEFYLRSDMLPTYSCHNAGVALLLEAGASAPASGKDGTGAASAGAEGGALVQRLALWARVAEEAAKLAAPQGLAERTALLPAGVF